MTTLRQLHDELTVKQTVKIYVNNTNKKYSTNFTADEELDKMDELLIRLNTLGKHRKHSQQMDILSDLYNEAKYQKNRNVGLKARAERAEKRGDQAEKIIEKDNLKDAYIKELKEYAYFNSQLLNWISRTAPKRTVDYLENKGIKYVQHISITGVSEIFKDRIKWFEDEIKK